MNFSYYDIVYRVKKKVGDLPFFYRLAKTFDRLPFLKKRK